MTEQGPQSTPSGRRRDLNGEQVAQRPEVDRKADPARENSDQRCENRALAGLQRGNLVDTAPATFISLCSSGWRVVRGWWS